MSTVIEVARKILAEAAQNYGNLANPSYWLVGPLVPRKFFAECVWSESKPVTPYEIAERLAARHPIEGDFKMCGIPAFIVYPDPGDISGLPDDEQLAIRLKLEETEGGKIRLMIGMQMGAGDLNAE